jgi:hypothetical protein
MDHRREELRLTHASDAAGLTVDGAAIAVVAIPATSGVGVVALIHASCPACIPASCRSADDRTATFADESTSELLDVGALVASATAPGVCCCIISVATAARLSRAYLRRPILLRYQAEPDCGAAVPIDEVDPGSAPRGRAVLGVLAAVSVCLSALRVVLPWSLAAAAGGASGRVGSVVVVVFVVGRRRLGWMPASSSSDTGMMRGRRGEWSDT